VGILFTLLVSGSIIVLSLHDILSMHRRTGMNL